MHDNKQTIIMYLHDGISLQINGWCKEAGEGITLEYEVKEPKNGITKLDSSNYFWVAFKKAADDLYVLFRFLAWHEDIPI